jgi:hypothetical protein
MKRALIDWDFEAHGIWIINFPRESASSPKVGHGRHWSGISSDRSHQFRPWSDLLTLSLLDRLQSWNEWGCLLGGPASSSQFGDKEWETFYREGKGLAEATQKELGDQWQVLWASNGAWHFVRFP